MSLMCRYPYWKKPRTRLTHVQGCRSILNDSKSLIFNVATHHLKITTCNRRNHQRLIYNFLQNCWSNKSQIVEQNICSIPVNFVLKNFPVFSSLTENVKIVKHYYLFQKYTLWMCSYEINKPRFFRRKLSPCTIHFFCMWQFHFPWNKAK